ILWLLSRAQGSGFGSDRGLTLRITLEWAASAAPSRRDKFYSNRKAPPRRRTPKGTVFLDCRLPIADCDLPQFNMYPSGKSIHSIHKAIGNCQPAPKPRNKGAKALVRLNGPGNNLQLIYYTSREDRDHRWRHWWANCGARP